MLPSSSRLLSLPLHTLLALGSANLESSAALHRQRPKKTLLRLHSTQPQRRHRPQSTPPATMTASTAAPTTTPLYSPTVAKTTTAPVPDDAAEKKHHVKSQHGERLRFANPHPSAGPTHTMTSNLGRMFKYVAACELGGITGN
jgi:hypothetical protein